MRRKDERRFAPASGSRKDKNYWIVITVPDPYLGSFSKTLNVELEPTVMKDAQIHVGERATPEDTRVSSNVPLKDAPPPDVPPRVNPLLR